MCQRATVLMKTVGQLRFPKLKRTPLCRLLETVRQEPSLTRSGGRLHRLQQPFSCASPVDDSSPCGYLWDLRGISNPRLYAINRSRFATDLRMRRKRIDPIFREFSAPGGPRPHEVVGLHVQVPDLRQPPSGSARQAPRAFFECGCTEEESGLVRRATSERYPLERMTCRPEG
jgi:hypothetical protein